MLHIWITRPVSQPMNSNIEWLYLVCFFLVLWHPVLTFNCPLDFCAVIKFSICTTMIQRIIRLFKFQISTRRRFNFFYRPVEHMSVFSNIVTIIIFNWRSPSTLNWIIHKIQVMLNWLSWRLFSRIRLLIFLHIFNILIVFWQLYYLIPFLHLVHIHFLNR